MSLFSSRIWQGLAQHCGKTLLKEGRAIRGGQRSSCRDHFHFVELHAAGEKLHELMRLDPGGIDVDQEQVRLHFLRQRTAFEDRFGNLHAKPAVCAERFAQQSPEVPIRLDDQHANLVPLDPVERQPMSLHESDQLLKRNSAILAPGDPITAQLAGIEPLGDRPRGHLAQPGAPGRWSARRGPDPARRVSPSPGHGPRISSARYMSASRGATITCPRPPREVKGPFNPAHRCGEGADLIGARRRAASMWRHKGSLASREQAGCHVNDSARPFARRGRLSAFRRPRASGKYLRTSCAI